MGNTEPKVGRAPRGSLVSRDWLTGHTAFLVKQSIYRTHSYLFPFATVAPGQELHHLGLVIYFQDTKASELVITLGLKAGAMEVPGRVA